jgi:hypothetical protein
MSIFVSVVSYRDEHLEMTLKSAVKNAKYPEELVFGIVNQDTERQQIDLSFLPRYSLITMHPKFARGVGYARAKAQTLYCDETHYMQVDSHTQFLPDWDINCMKQLKLAEQRANNKKVLLSAYPPPYIYSNNRVHFPTESTEEYPLDPVKHKLFLRTNGDWAAERVEFDEPWCGLPEESNTILGGFVFASGKIVKEIPYDEEISFMGEEVCFAMRAWTRGWDIYSPARHIVHHFYKRDGHKKIWNDDLIVREKNWDQLQEISKIKQENVLRGIETGTYGAGTNRTIKDYENFTGYNFNQVYDDLTNGKGR